MALTIARRFAALMLLVVVQACTHAPGAPAPAQPGETTVIYANAHIITLDPALPVASAVAVRSGRILAVGDDKTVARVAGGAAQVMDMRGKTITPGFIDAHGHISVVASAFSMADLQPPPAGPVSRLADLGVALRAWRADHPDATWLVGRGYDDSLLAEKRHPTRADLDSISTELPIVVVHASGHLLSCNSRCLSLSGITASTPDPPGGVIRRTAGGREPSGVLEEAALQLVLAHVPPGTPADRQAHLRQAQDLFARFGVTTVQDGAASPQDIADLEAMAARGELYLDVVSYLQHTSIPDLSPDFVASRDYAGHFRIGGVKLTLDGSPQGKTAWLSQPYLVPPEGQSADYRGYPILPDAQVEKLVAAAFARNIQVLAHTNGDAAIDQMLGAVERTNRALGRSDRRPVLIHAQTAREDQLDRMKTEGVIPSFFVAHTFFWGDWHRASVLGEKRASRISPLKTALARDIEATVHNDAPVVPPDMMRLMWTAVNRQTRSGQTLGPDQRVSAHEALKAVTIHAARQYFEEDRKGSITAGKLADFTVLSADPLSVAPGAIKDIEVVATIKEGQVIFQAAPPPGTGAGAGR